MNNLKCGQRVSVVSTDGSTIVDAGTVYSFVHAERKVAVESFYDGLISEHDPERVVPEVIQ